MDKNMRAGYQGKFDAMRALADKIMGPDEKIKEVIFSKSCADNQKMRPFKEGGMVESKKHENDAEYCKGGRASSKKMLKFAAGGIAKYRHDQMTLDGKQKGTKQVPYKNTFE